MNSNDVKCKLHRLLDHVRPLLELYYISYIVDESRTLHVNERKATRNI